MLTDASTSNDEEYERYEGPKCSKKDTSKKSKLNLESFSVKSRLFILGLNTKRFPKILHKRKYSNSTLTIKFYKVMEQNDEIISHKLRKITFYFKKKFKLNNFT